MFKNAIAFFTLLFPLLFCHIQAEQLFMVVTPEKTGTHLLTKAISMLTNKGVRNNWLHTLKKDAFINELEIAKQNNQFLQMHALPTPEIISTLKEKGYKVIFLMRDPRDVLISLFYYIEQGWIYGPLRLDWGYRKLSPNDKIGEMITGNIFHCQAIGDIIVRRIPWMQQEPGFVYTVHFENLVGPKGGGSSELQLMELVNIANNLQLEVSTSHIESIAPDLFGKPGDNTFRQGKIGSWRSHLVPENIRLMKIIHGKLLIQLGYEEDFSW